MVTKIKSAALNGIDSRIVEIETDISSGLPGMELIGSLCNQVKESKERVRVALKNNGISFPPCKITINISPADIKKDGTSFDLPIAVSLLLGFGTIACKDLSDILFVGELSLDGRLNRIRGVLPIVLEAKNSNIKTCIVPKENAKEGAMVDGIDVVGVSHISELILYLNEKKEKRNNILKPENKTWYEINIDNVYELDFVDVSGQDSVKRAMEVAAAGFHNILMVGPPGSGKSMLAKRLPTILPNLSFEESMEVSKIYSVCGLLNDKQNYIFQRPFVSPHHSITSQAMTGGGKKPTPGIISKAHKGVLFLDEIVHFPSNTLETLRQPIEDKHIHVVRTDWNCIFPADFMLVGAMNPCPCGHYPDHNKCNCTPEQISRYINKLSGPILDRFDICVEARKVEIDETRKKGNVSSETMRSKVVNALLIQRERYKDSNILFNSQLSAYDIQNIELAEKERQLLDEIYEKMNLSIRGYHRIIKVARTIADLDECKDIGKKHILEAVSYRSIKDKYWRI